MISRKSLIWPVVDHSDLKHGIHWPKLHNSWYAFSVLYYCIMSLMLLLTRLKEYGVFLWVGEPCIYTEQVRLTLNQ